MGNPERREGQTCLPVAVWYLFSEGGEPLGQLYRREDEAAPGVGLRLSGTGRWDGAEVVAFEELRPTCAMRRYRVVLRLQDSV